MSFLGMARESPNVSCFRATPRLHRCKSEVALQQETFPGLPHPPTRPLAPSPINLAGEIKVSTSTVEALFLKMALTGQRIAIVDMAFLVFTAFPYLPQGWMEPAFASEDFLFLLS